MAVAYVIVGIDVAQVEGEVTGRVCSVDETLHACGEEGGRRVREGWEKGGRRVGGGWEEGGRRVRGGWGEVERRVQACDANRAN
jgi:hypothetical protein